MYVVGSFRCVSIIRDDNSHLDHTQFDASLSAACSLRLLAIVESRRTVSSTDASISYVYICWNEIHWRHCLSKSSDHTIEDRIEPVRQRLSRLWSRRLVQLFMLTRTNNLYARSFLFLSPVLPKFWIIWIRINVYFVHIRNRARTRQQTHRMHKSIQPMQWFLKHRRIRSMAHHRWVHVSWPILKVNALVFTHTHTHTRENMFYVDTFSLLESTMNFISPSAYSLVNPDLASYAADAFVYSQLSDLNYRSSNDPSSSSSSSSSSSTSHHAARMSPYARQAFYPMYTQRDIHSPSRTAADYAWTRTNLDDSPLLFDSISCLQLVFCSVRCFSSSLSMVLACLEQKDQRIVHSFSQTNLLVVSLSIVRFSLTL
jgi:hypothetical protein